MQNASQKLLPQGRKIAAKLDRFDRMAWQVGAARRRRLSTSALHAVRSRLVEPARPGLKPGARLATGVMWPIDGIFSDIFRRMGNIRL
ncbi:hypothetical protein C1879_04985 [Paraeggerthella hongkongensis]|nr:hypothetical protein C1879_04985 [Paraeggerthella hongkongensis]